MIRIIFHTVIAALLIAMLPGMAGCQSNDVLTNISNELEVDAHKGTVIFVFDDHGGFHGDGTGYVKISFSNSDCLDEIKESSAWKPLPLTENIAHLVSIIQYDLQREDGNPEIPEIKNGYYCFVDRHSESRDRKDDSEVFDRHSYNFTVAIYDTDTDILYYMGFDT